MSSSLIIERNGPVVINGLTNGKVEIVTLFDAFLAFSGVLNDRVILEGTDSVKITHLNSIGDDLISGDHCGTVKIWDLNTKLHKKKFAHHSHPIVSSFAISSNFIALVDEKGRMSVIDTENLKFSGFLGTRHVPVSTVRWTTEGDLKVCIIYKDHRIQIWNLVSGNCEKECSSSLPGIEEVLQSFHKQHEIFNSGGSIQSALGNPMLASALSWRHAKGPDDPVQVLIIDIRKLIDSIKSLIAKKPDETGINWIKLAVSFIIPLLIPFGVDGEVDSWAHKLGYGHRRRDVILGLMGANGNLAFAAPSLECGWGLSGTVCATYYLSIASIFEITIDFGEDWDRLRMALSSRLLESGLSKGIFFLPSFSFASKYWHDLGEELRHGSRLLIVQTLTRMDERMIGKVIEYWSALLPANEGSEARKMNRAAIILGIVAVHRPEFLTAAVRKMVADSLMSLLMDEKRNLFRSAAIELIGKAYNVWDGHVHALSVFRLLLGWLSGMSQIDESGPVAQLVVPFENAATLDTLDSVRGTLLKLAAAAPEEILPLWLGQDFIAARTTIEKWTSISLLSDLVRQRPRVLRPFVTLVAETACRLVDGGSVVGNTKTRLLAITMPLINDLITSFPSAAYHRESFRLAAASPVNEVTINLFDMRGSASVRHFEGHTQPITALGFTPDGRFLLSYSWQEATLRWWQVPSGLIGFLGGTVKPFHTDVVDPALTENIQKHLEEISELETNEMISFHWTDDDLVQISIAEAVISIVKIPIH